MKSFIYIMCMEDAWQTLIFNRFVRIDFFCSILSHAINIDLHKIKRAIAILFNR